jgi:hypothetical protein
MHTKSKTQLYATTMGHNPRSLVTSIKAMYLSGLQRSKSLVCKFCMTFLFDFLA